MSNRLIDILADSDKLGYIQEDMEYVHKVQLKLQTLHDLIENQYPHKIEDSEFVSALPKQSRNQTR